MYFKDYRGMEQLKRDHEECGNKWFPWLLRADELIASAELLRNNCITRKYLPNDLEKYEDGIPSPGGKVFSVILMLWAMAAECLLKALWLKSGEKLIINGRYSKIPKTNNHDLCTLAEAISQKGTWDLEVFYAKDPKVWISEAINLWFSAKVLYDQQWDWTNDKENVFSNYPAFFGHRVIRMLVGFALENLIKAYLIKEKGKDIVWFRKEGNFKIGGKGHDLIWLFEEADFTLNEQEKHFLELCSICALWAGRYPIAVNENDMPRTRKSMPSSDDLHNRRVKMREKSPTDPQTQYGDFWDLLHGGIGDLEYSLYEEIYNKLKEKLV